MNFTTDYFLPTILRIFEKRQISLYIKQKNRYERRQKIQDAIGAVVCSMVDPSWLSNTSIGSKDFSLFHKNN
jgi:hypothetical protein